MTSNESYLPGSPRVSHIVCHSAREVSETLERRFGFISANQFTKLETFISKLSLPGLVRKPNNQIFHSDELPEVAREEPQKMYDNRRKSDVDLCTLTYLQLMLAAQFAARAGCALRVRK